MAFKMKGFPYSGKSPMKDEEWIDTADGRSINMHQGDPKIKRGEKGHKHSTSYIARYNPPKLEKTKKDE
tara:strand:+ start:26 stop:232 length:207 start_codon:yes stop_codon:yes gene_type:complete